MDQLPSAPLMTLTLDVGLDRSLAVGATPAGRRRIVPINGGAFHGDRLRGVVLPGGADWVVNRPDGALRIDVRITLQTHDKVVIYCSYQGLMKAPAKVMAQIGRGETPREADYRLRTSVHFECGDERYAWLNDLIAIGVGAQTATGPTYTIFEVL